MPDYRPPVDVEALVIQHLKADPLVTVPDNRISSELPSTFKAEPRLQVVRIGGGQAQPGDPADYLDAPLIQLMAYDDDRPGAHTVARMGLAGVMRMRTAVHVGAVVTNVQRVQGPYWVPDPLSKVPRYITGLILHVHPAAA